MLKYGSKTYPDSLDAIIRDKALVHVFYTFLKSEYSEHHLVFYMTPFKPKIQYETFIAVGSKTEVNIGYKDRQIAHDLAKKAAENPLMWKHPDWVDAIQVCKREVRLLLEKDSMMRFWTSEHFERYHVKNGGQAEDLQNWNPVEDPAPPPPWQLAAEHFGFKNAKAMQAYIAAFERNGENKTLGAAAKLLRSEGKTLNAHIFNKLLISEGFAKKPAGFDGEPQEQQVEDSEEQITLVPRNLQKCGFQEVKKAENVKQIKAMVLAHLAKDRQEGIKAYNKLLKLEPQNKPLQQTTYVDMMKKMREQKAYTVGEAT